MIDAVDTWRAARILITQHGADAAIVASRRAEALRAEDDVEGERVFKMIRAAVHELQRSKPNVGERVK